MSICPKRSIHRPGTLAVLILLISLLCGCTRPSPFRNELVDSWKAEFTEQYPDVKVSIVKRGPAIEFTFSTRTLGKDHRSEILSLVEELIALPEMVDAIFSVCYYTEEDINPPPHVYVWFDYGGEKQNNVLITYLYKDGAYQK